jgi:hypothetical protein
MENIQYDMFMEKGPLVHQEAVDMRLRMAQCENMAHNVRKGVYSRVNEQSKMMLAMMEEIEALKKKINEMEGQRMTRIVMPELLEKMG